MRVLIRDELHDNLTPEVERSVSSVRKTERVEGAVLSPDDATRFYLSQTKRIFMSLAAIVLVLSLGLALLADPHDWAITIGCAIATNVALALVFVIMLRRRGRIWNATLSAHASGLPPVGTAIVVDGPGLSLGGRTIPWSALRIDQVDFNEVRGNRYAVAYFIERLSLATATDVVVLDAAMIAKGRLLIGNAWVRLRPQLVAAPQGIS